MNSPLHPSRFSALSRRGFLLASGAVAGSLALAACGGNKTTPPSAAPAATSGASGGTAYNGPAVQLAFWNGWTGADGDQAKKMVDQFNAANPKIKVQMNVYQWADFFKKLPAAVRTGNGPDIAVMHIDDIATNAAQQVITPITDIATALGLKASDFDPAVWQGGIYQDARYGIPIDVHNLGLYYNKDLFEKAGLDADKPPTNKDEYMAALDKLKGVGIQGSWVSPFQFTGGFQFESLLWQYGGALFNADVTQADWSSQAGVNALTFMVDLIKNGYSPKNVAQDADYIALKNSKNAMNWQGIWQVNDVTTLKGVRIGLAPLPSIGGAKGVWGNSHQFVLPVSKSADANKAEASRYFINWFTAHGAEWAESAKVPASKEQAAGAAFKKLTNLVPFAEEVPAVHFPPAVAGVGDALAKVYDAVNAAVLGTKDPASALGESAKIANGILADNKKRFG
jgi:multiple sugar transport system substrate-binding protein